MLEIGRQPLENEALVKFEKKRINCLFLSLGYTASLWNRFHATGKYVLLSKQVSLGDQKDSTQLFPLLYILIS